MSSTSMEEKGRDLARCLGYRALHGEPDGGGAAALDEASLDDGIDDASPRRTNDASDVDLWHLRALAMQSRGLLNGRGRKLGWIKLGGVDELVFRKEYRGIAETPHPVDEEEQCTYEEIREYLDEEMKPSVWHIQRERRRLRGKKGRGEGRRRVHHHSSNMSYASSTNDLSSIGSESGSSTPLTANLGSNAGTPKSVTWADGPSSVASVGAPLPFTAFATKSYCTESSSTTSYASFPSITIDTTFANTTLVKSTHEDDNTPTLEEASPSSNDETDLEPPSPLSFPFPSVGGGAKPPQCQPTQFQFDITPKSYLEYSQKYQRRHKLTKPKIKKDKRQKERKLLVQITASSFYLLHCHNPELNLQCYPGLQDLIAVMLLHLESPSMVSLLLRQVLESHLWMFCAAKEDDDESGDDDGSFASCISVGMDDAPDSCGVDEEGKADGHDIDALSLSFFPLLQVLDEEMHASLTRMDDGQDFLRDRVFVVGKALRKWISSWYCCHDALSLEVVSRLVDFFLASHPLMPLYLSVAIMCHPAHRDRFIAVSRQTRKLPSQCPPEGDVLATMLEHLFSDLAQELDHGDDNEVLVDFMEHSISTAIGFMKQVPPQQLVSLLKKYQNGNILPYVNPAELERLSSVSLWTKRPSAPTDYNMIERMYTTTKFGSTLLWFPFFLTTFTKKHQIALDASGLSTSKGSRITSSKAIICGAALCAVVGLAAMFSGSNTSSAFVGQKPFDHQVAEPMPPQVLEDDTFVDVPPLEDTDVSPSTSMAPSGTDADSLDEMPLIAPDGTEGEVEHVIYATKGLTVEEMAVDTSLPDAGSETEAEKYASSLPERDETPIYESSRDESEHKLNVVSGEIEVARAHSGHHFGALVKRRALESLVGLRDGFTAMVESDDLFL